MKVWQQYLEEEINALRRIERTQPTAIEQAARILADCTKNDGIILGLRLRSFASDRGRCLLPFCHLRQRPGRFGRSRDRKHSDYEIRIPGKDGRLC